MSAVSPSTAAQRRRRPGAASPSQLTPGARRGRPDLIVIHRRIPLGRGGRRMPPTASAPHADCDSRDKREWRTDAAECALCSPRAAPCRRGRRPSPGWGGRPRRRETTNRSTPRRMPRDRECPAAPPPPQLSERQRRQSRSIRSLLSPASRQALARIGTPKARRKSENH